MYSPYVHTHASCCAAGSSTTAGTAFTACVEIVDNPALAFSDLDEAVERFNAVLTSETSASAVRSHRDERTYQFTTYQFYAQLRGHVNAFLHEQLSEPPAKLTKGRPQST